MEEKLKNLTVSQAVLIGLVLAGVYYFSLYDDGAAIQTNINNVKSQMQTSKIEIDTVKKAIIDAERYQQAKLALGAEMEKVLLAIPQKLTSTDLMKIMSNEAKTVGAEIVKITAPQLTASADDKLVFYEPVPIEIALGGTYNQLMLFLSNLTKLDKILTAKNLALTLRASGTGVSSVPRLNMIGYFQAYRYKSDATAGKGK